MTKTMTAHFTDAHLGQRLVTSADMAGEEIRYDDAPGEYEARLRCVLEDIARKGISDIVFGGDIGSEQSAERFFTILSEYSFSSSIVLGNHDRLHHVSRYWNTGSSAVEGKMCSSRDDGHMKRILLDTSDNSIGDRQLEWLERELRDTAKAVLFLHHPILAIDTPLERSGAALKDRRALTALLTGVGCDISVFCGHYHMIDHVAHANVRQYVTPAVSYQIVKQSDRIRVDTGTFGYRIVEIDQADVKTEIVMLTAPF